MRPPLPVLFTTPELRGAGTVALVGAAAVATYDPSTGVGSATRVDLSNQSYVTFPAVNGRTYAINITTVEAVLVRNSPTGPVQATTGAGTTMTYFVTGASGAVVITSSAGTANFTVNSYRAR